MSVATQAPARHAPSIVARTLRDGGVRLAGARVLALCSGGADSVALVALLDALPRGSRPRSIDVLFCDHGLRDGVESERAAAAAAADRVGATLHERASRGLDTTDGGTEAAARRWRYEVAVTLAAELGCTVVATGHGAHDQVEQALLSLLGVTGPAGSGATMPVARELAPGISLVRPLLALDRVQLELACADAGLVPALDPTNLDADAHVRNAVRHRVVPQLLAACPGAGPVLARAGERARADVEARHALADALLDASGSGDVLPLRLVTRLAPPAQREIVARWLARVAPGRGITARIVTDVTRLAIAPARAACARVDLPGGACVRRDGYDLVVQPDPPRGGPCP